MKQFNLEDALAGKKVITRSGDPVTEIYYFKTSKSSQKLFCVVDGDTLSFYDSGAFSVIEKESQYDLFMAPEEVVRWVNVYEGYNCTPYAYHSKESAATAIDQGRVLIGTFPLPITL